MEVLNDLSLRDHFSLQLYLKYIKNHIQNNISCQVIKKGNQQLTLSVAPVLNPISLFSFFVPLKFFGSDLVFFEKISHTQI